MTTTVLYGEWDVQKFKLKQKFTALTDNDLFLMEDGHEELFEKLQIKLGITKEELLNIIVAL
jgi:hypothetical protein